VPRLWAGRMLGRGLKRLMAPGEGAQAFHIRDIRASDVTTKPVEWEWRARIPKAKLVIFDGDPDLGKSLVTLDIAARKSTGRAFPDGAPCKAGNVLIVNVEDGVEDTIVPRLKAHGADLERVYIFSSVPDVNGGTRLLELPQDIALLENKVRQRRANLLIMDPILTMLGGDPTRTRTRVRPWPRFGIWLSVSASQ
jgi:putative DNA primase/helicase